MRRLDDAALFGLPVDHGQAGDGDDFAADEIGQNLSGGDAGKLLVITDDDQSRPFGDGPDEGGGEADISHGELVGDEVHLGEGVRFIMGEALEGEAQRAVDGRSAMTGDLAQTFGRAPRRGHELDGPVDLLLELDHPQDDLLRG